MENTMINVFGHLNPDSDSVCSALVTADWLSHQGKAAKAWRLGKLNPETTFILEQAGRNAPDLLEDDLTDKPVWLVDFSYFEQGPSSLAAANILGIYDHHNLGTVTTKSPLEMIVKPVGSTATLLWMLIAQEDSVTLSQSQATLLLGAVLSDTVCLTSSTTTETDKIAVEALFALSQLDRETFTQALIDAKTDIRGYTAQELLEKDAKIFKITDKHIQISQLEVNNRTDIASVLPELLQGLTTYAEQKDGVDVMVLMLTNIDTRESQLYFSHDLLGQPSPIILENALSRKKDALPWLITEVTARAK